MPWQITHWWEDCTWLSAETLICNPGLHQFRWHTGNCTSTRGSTAESFLPFDQSVPALLLLHRGGSSVMEIPSSTLLWAPRDQHNALLPVHTCLHCQEVISLSIHTEQVGCNVMHVVLQPTDDNWRRHREISQTQDTSSGDYLLRRLPMDLEKTISSTNVYLNIKTLQIWKNK